MIIFFFKDWTVTDPMSTVTLTPQFTIANNKATGITITHTNTNMANGEQTFRLTWTNVPDVLGTGQMLISFGDSSSASCQVGFFIYDVEPAAALASPNLDLCPITINQHALWKCQLVPTQNPTDLLSDTTITASIQFI